MDDLLLMMLIADECLSHRAPIDGKRRGDEPFVSKYESYQVAARAKVSSVSNFAGVKRCSDGADFVMLP